MAYDNNKNYDIQEGKKKILTFLHGYDTFWSFYDDIMKTNAYNSINEQWQPASDTLSLGPSCYEGRIEEGPRSQESIRDIWMFPLCPTLWLFKCPTISKGYLYCHCLHGWDKLTESTSMWRRHLRDILQHYGPTEEEEYGKEKVAFRNVGRASVLGESSWEWPSMMNTKEERESKITVYITIAHSSPAQSRMNLLGRGNYHNNALMKWPTYDGWTMYYY